MLQLRAMMGCEFDARAWGSSGEWAVKAAADANVAFVSDAAASTSITADVVVVAARVRRVLHPYYMFQRQVCKRHHVAADAKHNQRACNFWLKINAGQGADGGSLSRTGKKMDWNSNRLRHLSCEVDGSGLVARSSTQLLAANFDTHWKEVMRVHRCPLTQILLLNHRKVGAWGVLRELHAHIEVSMKNIARWWVVGGNGDYVSENQACKAEKKKKWFFVMKWGRWGAMHVLDPSSVLKLPQSQNIGSNAGRADSDVEMCWLLSRSKWRLS
jgi:hypothetical protein